MKKSKARKSNYHSSRSKQKSGNFLGEHEYVQNVLQQAPVHEKSSSKSQEKMTTSDWINLAMAFFALLSVIFSAWTVHQMYQDRKAAYRPDILINPIDVEIEWDKDRNESWLSVKENKSFAPDLMEGDSAPLSGKTELTLQSFINGSLETLPIANIGAGTAKNILVSWDLGNTQRLLDSLIECDSNYSDFCTVGEKSTVFSYANHHLVQVDNERDSTYMYMLPANEDNEAKSFPFPLAYSILIHELIKTGSFYDYNSNHGPYIFLTISYSDILNNDYEKHIMFTIKRTFFTESEDGSGSAIYQITPSYAKE